MPESLSHFLPIANPHSRRIFAFYQHSFSLSTRTMGRIPWNQMHNVSAGQKCHFSLYREDHSESCFKQMIIIADVTGNERIMAAIDKRIKPYNFCK